MNSRLPFLAALAVCVAMPAKANPADFSVVQKFMDLAGKGNAAANQLLAPGARFQDGDFEGQLDGTAYRDRIKGCTFVEFGQTKEIRQAGMPTTIVQSNWDCLSESGSVLLPIGFVFTVQSGKIVRMELISI